VAVAFAFSFLNYFVNLQLMFIFPYLLESISQLQLYFEVSTFPAYYSQIIQSSYQSIYNKYY